MNNSISYILKDTLYKEFDKLDTIRGFYIEHEELLSISELYLTQNNLFNKEFQFLLDSSLTDKQNFFALIKLDSLDSCNVKLDTKKIILYNLNSNLYLYYDYNCILNTLSIRVNFLNTHSESINIEYFFKFIDNKPILLYNYRLY